MRSMFSSLWKVMFRRKALVLSVLFGPIISLLMVYGILALGNEEKTKIGITDRDHTVQSRQVLEELQKNPRYQLYENLEETALSSYIENAKLEIVVTIPNGFGKSLAEGNILPLEVLSRSDSEAQGWLISDLNFLVDRMSAIGKVAENEEQFQRIQSAVQHTKWNLHKEVLGDEFQGRSTVNRAVGILMLFLLSATFFLTEQMVTDKESGITKRILLARSDFRSYLLSLAGIGTILILLQIVIIQLGIFAMGLNMHMNPLLYTGILFAFGLASVGMMLFLGCVCSKSFTALTIINICNVPMLMLAGALWPVKLMPKFMQDLAKYLPQNWTMSAVSCAQDGNLSGYAMYFGLLLVLAVVFFSMTGIVAKRKKYY